MRARRRYADEAPVEKSCPDCGAEAEYVEATARVLQGTCSECGRTFTILEQTQAGSGGPSGSPPEAASDEETTQGAREASTIPAGPPCSVCGAALAVRASAEGSLEAQCSSCSTTFTYVLATSPPAEPTRTFRPRGRPPRDEGGGFGPSRSRPCRECGGPLRFSTDPDGNVTGECGSCGNRFTLPPRREFGRGRGDGGDRGRPRRSGPPSFRRQGRYPPRRDSGGEGPRYRGGGPSFRRRDRRDDAEDDDSTDRRRRRFRRE